MLSRRAGGSAGLYPLARADSFIAQYGLVPYEFLHGVDLPPTILLPIWITLLTSMFLHGSLLHVLGNMLYLWVFGDNVEDAMGHARFLVFYLICGVAAALAQTTVDPGSAIPQIGASGAIAGVLAAYFMLFPFSRILTLIPLLFFVRLVADSCRRPPGNLVPFAGRERRGKRHLRRRGRLVRAHRRVPRRSASRLPLQAPRRAGRPVGEPEAGGTLTARVEDATEEPAPRPFLWASQIRRDLLSLRVLVKSDRTRGDEE